MLSVKYVKYNRLKLAKENISYYKERELKQKRARKLKHFNKIFYSLQTIIKFRDWYDSGIMDKLWDIKVRKETHC